MEQTHHPSSLCVDPVTRTNTSDTEAEKHIETQGGTEYKGGIANGEGMKTVNETAPIDDVSDGLSVKMHQRLSISKGPFRSRRPRLQWTKSFPPFSQCAEGPDESERVRQNDSGEEVQCYSEPRVTHRPHLRVQQRLREGSTEEVQFKQERGDDERTNDTMTTRESRDELKAKWRATRRQRLGGSDGPRWVRIERWNGRGRMEETGGKQDGKAMRRGKETRPPEEVKGGSLDSGGMFHDAAEGDIGMNSETDGKEAEGEDRNGADHSEMEGGSDGSGRINTMDEVGEGPVKQTTQWSSPHPILSRLLQSSASFTFSSAESDEVFSDKEDAGSKRNTLRKCRSWKTFLNMMQWSVGQRSSWVQLAGHQGNFQTSEGGEVLKLYSDVEASCLACLMTDPLKPFVPQYHGLMTRGGHTYVRLEDLLFGLKRPVIMDCKMGVRTYLEEELFTARNKPKLRSDLYEKMVKADPTAPTAEEHAEKGVTKWRYLQWKDKTTSTSTLGFRIEGIMMENGSIQRDFRKIRTLAQVTDALLSFTKSQLHILKAYHSRLQALSEALNESPFFKTHEVIGSSLLFVHDHSSKASVWMIDFGKTISVLGTELQHNVPWAEGNGEDGYLIGLASLTSSLSQAISKASSWCQDGNSGAGNTEEITIVD